MNIDLATEFLQIFFSCIKSPWHSLAGWIFFWQILRVRLYAGSGTVSRRPTYAALYLDWGKLLMQTLRMVQDVKITRAAVRLLVYRLVCWWWGPWSVLASPLSHQEGGTPLLGSTARWALSHPCAPFARHRWLVSPVRPVLCSRPPLGDTARCCHGQSCHIPGYLSWARQNFTGRKTFMKN